MGSHAECAWGHGAQKAGSAPVSEHSSNENNVAKPEKLSAVKGMNDILPAESARWEWLEAQVRELMARFAYRNVRTPIVEPTPLFVRGIGEATDIVEKEMYTFADKGGDSLTLRPEATAGLVRAAILIPWAIPTIVSAKMWGWMLHDQFGVINHWLLKLGIISQNIAWTAESDYALWTVVVVDVWKTTPFMALLILAALQTLPKDCYEAAKVDGVHPLRAFWKITLPLIKPALMVAVIFRLLDALRVFDLIFVLTSSSNSTISMSGFVRREMVDNGYVGFGSAASTALFLIISACTIVYMKIANGPRKESN